MKAFLTMMAAAALVAAADHDDGAPLDKPALVDSIDYLEQGLKDNLPDTKYTSTEWTDDQIPKDCADIANNEAKSPADFRIFDVAYEDCTDTPWTFCYHKESEVSIDSMATQFGKLPIQMRQWVRHVISIPNDGGHAYNSNANIVFFRPVEDMIRVFIHETGHSLDASAYNEPVAPSDNWWEKYDNDANAIDNYGKSSMVEEVAQAHVLAVYNENVPGKYEGIEPNAGNVFNQYATIITLARDNGKGSSIITPGQGEGEQCVHHNPSSDKVSKGAAAKMMSRRGAEKARKAKNDGCTLTW